MVEVLLPLLGGKLENLTRIGPQGPVLPLGSQIAGASADPKNVSKLPAAYNHQWIV